MNDQLRPKPRAALLALASVAAMLGLPGGADAVEVTERVRERPRAPERFSCAPMPTYRPDPKPESEEVRRLRAKRDEKMARRDARARAAGRLR